MADVIYIEGFKDLRSLYKNPTGKKSKNMKRLDCGHYGDAWLLTRGKGFCRECATNGRCDRIV